MSFRTAEPALKDVLDAIAKARHNCPTFSVVGSGTTTTFDR